MARMHFAMIRGLWARRTGQLRELPDLQANSLEQEVILHGPEVGHPLAVHPKSVVGSFPNMIREVIPVVVH